MLDLDYKPLHGNGDSMTEHILIKLSTSEPYADTPEMPASATYDPALGIWELDGVPMCENPDVNLVSMTKKRDIETGEDQKGE